MLKISAILHKAQLVEIAQQALAELQQNYDVVGGEYGQPAADSKMSAGTNIEYALQGRGDLTLALENALPLLTGVFDWLTRKEVQQQTLELSM